MSLPISMCSVISVLNFANCSLTKGDLQVNLTQMGQWPESHRAAPIAEGQPSREAAPLAKG